MNELSSFQLLIITAQYNHPWSSQVALVVKTLTANAKDKRDTGLILGLGRSPGGGHDNSLQYSFRENPSTAEPGELQFMGLQGVGHD